MKINFVSNYFQKKDTINQGLDWTNVQSNKNSLSSILSDNKRFFNIFPLPADKFFFNYEWNWWFRERMFELNNGFAEHIPIPKNVLNRIKNQTAYLTITISMESWVREMDLDAIHPYIKNLELPKSNVILFTASPNGSQIYKKYCEDRKLEECFTVEYLPFHHANFKNWVDMNIEEPYVIAERKKDFLLFNRRWHTHRVLLLYYLEKLNLLEKNYVSFLNYDENAEVRYSDAFKGSESFLSEPKDYELVTQIESKLPLVLDTPDLSGDQYMYLENDNLKYFYKNSFIHLISETYFFTDILHLTEKTLKPMYYKQPFIVITSPFYLKFLRQAGFKTFDKIWNESYDEEENHEKRFFKILNLIKEISNLSVNEKLSMMERCKEIIDHNFNILKSPNNPQIDYLLEKYGT